MRETPREFARRMHLSRWVSGAPKRGVKGVLQYAKNTAVDMHGLGCSPATRFEVQLWRALKAMDGALAAELKKAAK